MTRLLAEGSPSVGGSMAVWLLFIVAGMFVGGAWSAYQNGSKLMTMIMAVLAAVALLVALGSLFNLMPF
ncbi:hypothetical protein QP027_07265 [Corynebacterium breve]|uniref:Uncharacterized protein n=1 Tax=Corynebacterium breve TaxID=3049799 RepID=A0ABY8VCT8_9CORY|nr:hypothetical protein [Corynebacterium breve]WIM66932.1 hypothetical protein QP027_07265 [Corynebacterium breve]